jgi:hypothetical protein
MRELTKGLGISQNLSTVFHPQTDGLSECTNQWVKQYLHLITTNQNDWSQWLPMATAVHNNCRNSSTGLTPSELLIGWEPPLSFEQRTESKNQTAEEYLSNLRRNRLMAIHALNKIAYKTEVPQNRWSPGQLMWLEGRNLPLPYGTAKLAPRRHGPFQITKVISPVAVQLKLPPQWNIHPVFHNSLISAYTETQADGPNFTRPPPDLIDGEEEYEVEQIRSHRTWGGVQNPAIFDQMEGLPRKRQHLGKRRSNPCARAHQTLPSSADQTRLKSSENMTRENTTSHHFSSQSFLPSSSFSHHSSRQYSSPSLVLTPRTKHQVGMQSPRSPSPISVSSSDSCYPKLILCDIHGTPIDLTEHYRQQRQLTIRSAPPRTNFVDPMSSVGSYNASNESPNEAPIQLPPRLSSSTPMPLSPRTVRTTLEANSDIDNTMLQTIANGLLQTIADREASISVATKCYKDRLHHLEQKVLHYEGTFNHPPEGYELNAGKVTNFQIPVGDGLYQEAKWVRLNDDGTVSGYHGAQGPNQQPYIIDLYVAPDYSVDSPLEPLPAWFRHMLTGSGTNFQILQQAVADTGDWGFAREIARYRQIDNDITAVAIKIEEYQRDLDAAHVCLGSCESRLMLARAAERVAVLENVPRKMGALHSGWKKTSRMPREIHVRTAPLEDE